MAIIIINDRQVTIDDKLTAISRAQLLALAGGMPDAKVVVENASADGADKLLAEFDSVSLMPPLRVRIDPLEDYTVRFTESQIDHMVDRFLGWRLPENFNPDGGVKFEREVNGGPRPAAWWPQGTNILDATQAKAMVRYIVEGMPCVTQATDLQKALD